MAVASIPFKITASGAVRVGNTRVTLETVILTFLDGATAEEIVDRYSTLSLADVYSTIAYYLNNRSEVESYLERSKAEGDRVRAENELRFSTLGLRNRLLARLENRS